MCSHLRALNLRFPPFALLNPDGKLDTEFKALQPTTDIAIITVTISIVIILIRHSCYPLSLVAFALCVSGPAPAR